MIGLEHLEPGDLRLRSWADLADGTTFTNRVRPGQVLFGKRRAYQRKLAVADFDAICSGDIYVFESADPTRLLPDLLPFICQTDSFFEYAVGTSAGSLSPRTNWSSLAEYEFALPPLEEQRRLATQLLATFTMTDALSAALKANEALMQSCLQDHFTDQLRPAKCDVVKGTVRPLGEVLSLLQDGTHNPSRDRADDGPMLLSVTHLDGHRLKYGDNEARVSWSFYERERRRVETRPGDALLATIGFSLGKTGTVQADAPPFVLQRMVSILRANQQIVDQRYLRIYLDSPPFQRHLWARSKQTQQPAVYLGELAKIPIPVPAKAEQLQFVEMTDGLRSSLERLRSRHAKASQLRQGLQEPAL